MIQISVFLEDKPGVLASFIKHLMDNKIFIRALTIAKTSEYGLLLLLVDKPQKCIDLIEEKNYTYSTTYVIGVKMNHHPNALYKIPKVMGDKNLNIEYCYSTLVKEESLLILRVEDDIIEHATKTLEESGFSIIES